MNKYYKITIGNSLMRYENSIYGLSSWINSANKGDMIRIEIVYMSENQYISKLRL